MRSCGDTAPAVRSICPRGTNKPFQFWLCPWLLTNTDIKKKSTGVNNGLYCRPIELLQDYKHGARQSWREGMDAEKKGFSPRLEERITRFTSRWTELFHYSWALQLVNVVICLWYVCGTRKMFSVWQTTNRKLALQALLWTAALSCSLITNPGVLRWENWHHPPLFTACCLHETWLICCCHSSRPEKEKKTKSGGLCGNYGHAGLVLGWVGLLMTLQDQHKPQSGLHRALPWCPGLCL